MQRSNEAGSEPAEREIGHFLR